MILDRLCSLNLFVASLHKFPPHSAGLRRYMPIQKQTLIWFLISRLHSIVYL